MIRTAGCELKMERGLRWVGTFWLAVEEICVAVAEFERRRPANPAFKLPPA